MSKKKGAITYTTDISSSQLEKIEKSMGKDYDFLPEGISIQDYPSWVDSGIDDYYKREKAVDLAVKFIGVKGSAPQNPLIDTARQIYEFLTEKKAND